VIVDCPVAFQEVRRDADPEDPEQGPREITLRSNIVSMMRRYNIDDLGAVLRTKLSFEVQGNWFSHSATLSALPKLGPDDTFVGNVLYRTPFGAAPDTDWQPDNAGGNVTATDEQMCDVLVERRRWTRRGVVRLESAVRVGDALF
jgi:hypothetical protein